jgi:hypothetical protein
MPAGRSNDYQLSEGRTFSQVDHLAGTQTTLQSVSGQDSLSSRYETVSFTDSSKIDSVVTGTQNRTYAPGANGTVQQTYTGSSTNTITTTDLATGQVTVTSPQNPPPTPISGFWNFISKAAGYAQEVAGFVADAAVSGTKWIGATAYAVADKSAQPFLMGYDLLQCGYVGVYGAITGDYFEPNWASDLAKNAPKDPNDKEAWGRYMVEQQLANLKDGAVTIATMGAGAVATKAVSAAKPLVCKVLNTGCFAAGTPIRTPDGAKPIDQLQSGDLVLTRAEFDPEGDVVPRVVLGTIVNESRLLLLHVGGRIIRTTGDHLLFVRDRGWAAAQTLAPGDELLTESQGWVRCEAAVYTAQTEWVYNIEIVEHHTYFVGDESWGFAVWAHNECEGLHHLWPFKMGNTIPRGSKLLTPMSAAEHTAVHNGLRAHLGLLGMLPTKGNPGAAIVETFTATQRFKALADFYRTFDGGRYMNSFLNEVGAARRGGFLLP